MAGASGSRSPPKTVFQSPSNALHCGVFNGVLLRRRIAIIVGRSFSVPGKGAKTVTRGEGEWGERIRCFPLEFADGEAGNFYQRGNKGLWRWKGWIVETIYSSIFFFFFFGSFFRSIYCVLGNEKLNRREKSYKIEIVGLINFRSSLAGFMNK